MPNMTNISGKNAIAGFLDGFLKARQAKEERQQKYDYMTAQKKLLDAQLKQENAKTELETKKQAMLQRALDQLMGAGQEPGVSPTQEWQAPMKLPQDQTQAAPPSQGVPDMASNLLLRGMLKKEIGIDPGEINYRSGMVSPSTGKPITAGLDITGKIVKEYPDIEGEQKKTTQTFNQEKDLRDQFTSISKTFREVRDSYGRIIQSSKEPSAAGDLALIFNYMKMLDPGSTVREGEFANAQNAGGVPDIVRAQWNKLLSGERLSGPIRNDFVNRSDMLYTTANNQYMQLEGSYKKLAEQYGLDPSRVVVDFSLEKSLKTPPKLGKNKLTPEEEAAAYLGSK